MKRPSPVNIKKSGTILPPISMSLQNKSKYKHQKDLKSAPCLKIFDPSISVQKQRRLTIKQIIQQHYSHYEKDRIVSPLIIASALPYQNQQVGKSSQNNKKTIKLKMKSRQRRLKRLFVRYQDQQQFNIDALRKSKHKQKTSRSARCKTLETDETDVNLSRHCLYNFFRGKVMPIEKIRKKLEIQKNKIILKPKQTQSRSIQQSQRMNKAKSQLKPLTAIFDKPKNKKSIKDISLCGWRTKSDEENIE